MSMKDEIIWRPTEDQSASANVRRFMDRHGITRYDELVSRSVADIRWFWEACLNDLGVEWYQPYTAVLDDSRGFPWCRWFLSGKINLVRNCLDRHVQTRPDQVAIFWESDDGQTRAVTYRELHSQVCRIAAGMQELGIKRGDTVGIYMPMVPEIVTALLAAWKVGAVVVPVFAGFGPEALAVRLRDSDARLLFTADGSYRRGKPVRTKEAADQAFQSVPSVKSVIVLRRTGEPVSWIEGRDHWWHQVAADSAEAIPTQELNAEDLCLILLYLGNDRPSQGNASHARRDPGEGCPGTGLLHGCEERGPFLLAHRHGLDDGALGNHRDHVPGRVCASVRGRAQLAQPGPSVGHRGPASADPSWNLSHRHPAFAAFRR